MQDYTLAWSCLYLATTFMFCISTMIGHILAHSTNLQYESMTWQVIFFLATIVHFLTLTLLIRGQSMETDITRFTLVLIDSLYLVLHCQYVHQH